MTDGKEAWRDVRGYEGLYQVSSLGNFRSLERIVQYYDKRHKVTISRRFKGMLMKPVLQFLGKY